MTKPIDSKVSHSPPPTSPSPSAPARSDGLLRRVWRSDTGVSAVEFALVLPLLIAVLGGIIQFSSVFYLQNNMINVARDAARRVAIGELDETQAKVAAEQKLLGWGGAFNVQVVDPVTTADPNDTDVIVTISVPLAQASIVDLLGTFNVGDVSASVAMRSEGV